MASLDHSDDSYEEDLADEDTRKRWMCMNVLIVSSGIVVLWTIVLIILCVSKNAMWITGKPGAVREMESRVFGRGEGSRQEFIQDCPQKLFSQQTVVTSMQFLFIITTSSSSLQLLIAYMR